MQHGSGGAWRAIGHILGTRINSLGPSDQRVVVLFIANLNKDDLRFLGGLIDSGKVTPVIDRRYELGEAGVALAYMEEGHARSKVAIAVERR